MPSDPTGDAVIVQTALESSADLHRRLRSSPGSVMALRRLADLRMAPEQAAAAPTRPQQPLFLPSGHW